MEFRYSEEFAKELKKLKKKYRTLEADLAVLKKAINVTPTGNDTKHWNILHQNDALYIVKVRLMCRALKGASMRVIYVYNGNYTEILFIELYFKGDKDTEDWSRIKTYMGD